MTLETLARSTSHSPLALAWGSVLAINRRTVLTVSERFECLCYKPLKRLTTFSSAPYPKLKLGENEKWILQEAL